MILISSVQVTFDLYPKVRLRKLKLDNPNKIVIGHLNINSIRQKFVPLKEIIDDNIDILLISETKINPTFPVGQFTINRFHIPFREDRNDTPKIDTIFIEINLKKRKWLLIALYNPHKDMIGNHLDSIGKQLDILCEKYENIILLGDFPCKYFVTITILKI